MTASSPRFAIARCMKTSLVDRTPGADATSIFRLGSPRPAPSPGVKRGAILHRSLPEPLKRIYALGM